MHYNPGMKKNLIPVYLEVAACAIFFSSVALFAQQTTIKRVPAKNTVAVSGKGLYRQYCAVCHGTDGKGAGPAAEALKMRPTDLTLMSRNDGGRFPEARTLAILRGETQVAAHGSAEMPVWGTVLGKSATPDVGLGRLHALLNYIEEIQTK